MKRWVLPGTQSYNRKQPFPRKPVDLMPIRWVNAKVPYRKSPSTCCRCEEPILVGHEFWHPQFRGTSFKQNIRLCRWCGPQVVAEQAARAASADEAAPTPAGDGA